MNVRRRTRVAMAAVSMLGLVSVALIDTSATASAAVLSTKTSLSPSSGKVLVGSTVTVTATVSAENLGGLIITPTGTVTFSAAYDGDIIAMPSATVKSPCLLSKIPCTASSSVTLPSEGNWVISGSYSGDTLSKSSTGYTTVAAYTTPQAPGSLTAVASPYSHPPYITLSWAAPTDTGNSAIEYYNVYRSVNSGSLALYESDVPTLGFTNGGLTNGDTYTYAVTAVNAAGEGPMSAPASVTVAPDQPPGAPTNVVAYGGQSVITVGWDVPGSSGSSAITGYNIYRSTDDVNFTEIATGINAAPYSDTSVSDGTTYYYEVTATNSQGESPRSSAASAAPEESSAYIPTCGTVDCGANTTIADDPADGTGSTVSFNLTDGGDNSGSITEDLDENTLSYCSLVWQDEGFGDEADFTDTTGDTKTTTMEIVGTDAVTLHNEYVSHTDRLLCLAASTDFEGYYCSAYGDTGPGDPSGCINYAYGLVPFDDADNAYEGELGNCVNHSGQACWTSGPYNAAEYNGGINEWTVIADLPAGDPRLHL